MGTIAGRGELPAADLAAIATDDRLDIAGHEACQAAQVAFVEPEPTRQAGGGEIEERTRGNGPALAARPIHEGVVRLPPARSRFLRFNLAPRQRQADSVAGSG